MNRRRFLTALASAIAAPTALTKAATKLTAHAGRWEFPTAEVAEPLLGYVPCDGRALSRKAYAQLFSVLGELYGPGDGETTFNIPDLRGVSFGEGKIEERVERVIVAEPGDRGWITGSILFREAA